MSSKSTPQRDMSYFLTFWAKRSSVLGAAPISSELVEYTARMINQFATLPAETQSAILTRLASTPRSYSSVDSYQRALVSGLSMSIVKFTSDDLKLSVQEIKQPMKP